MYFYDISLGDIIGSTLSMVFQCIFSLPVSHSIRQATRFRTLSIPLHFRKPVSFLVLLDTINVQRSVSSGGTGGGGGGGEPNNFTGFLGYELPWIHHRSLFCSPDCLMLFTFSPSVLFSGSALSFSRSAIRFYSGSALPVHRMARYFLIVDRVRQIRLHHLLLQFSCLVRTNF